MHTNPLKRVNLRPFKLEGLFEMKAFLFRGGKGDGFVCIVYDSLKSGHPIHA
jgi:hypothetical protein